MPQRAGFGIDHGGFGCYRDLLGRAGDGELDVNRAGNVDIEGDAFLRDGGEARGGHGQLVDAGRNQIEQKSSLRVG